MELRATREMRRNEQLNKVLGKKAETEGTHTKAKAPKAQAPADKLSLSRQALDYLEQQNKLQQELDERQSQQHSLIQSQLDAMQTKKNELDALGKHLKVQSKCQKIAASIMKGDRVPPEDLAYLMKNDPEGYKLAMAMRRPKKDPEDCESVLDEEDKKSGSAGGNDGGGEPPEMSTPEISGGGEASAGE